MSKSFYSNGKLLLTGEYLVLDGALSLAIPTQFGQSLTVASISEPKLIWKSINDKGDVWFENTFSLQNNEILNHTLSTLSTGVLDDNDVSNRLLQILTAAKLLNSNFLNSEYGYKVTTKLDFPQFWGLGSSSTLINNIALWAEVNAFKLLEQTFGGSGYDIACAQYNFPITYQSLNKNSGISRPDPDQIAPVPIAIGSYRDAQNDKKREIHEVSFNPNFKDLLYFVHLNKKQNSRDGIAQYNANKHNSDLAISEINEITLKMITCNSVHEFEVLIASHEQIISKIIKQKPIKELLFNDYKGAIKSLGAWGGDFVLVTGNEDSMNYFRDNGYLTIVPYTKMVLN